MITTNPAANDIDAAVNRADAMMYFYKQLHRRQNL